jgi:hypothetical protein
MNSFACRITSLVGHAPDVATSLAFQGSPAICRVFLLRERTRAFFPAPAGSYMAAS